MRKVNAVIERASDGTYSIYSDAEDLGYLVTGTGETVEEAKRYFEGGYEDIKKSYARHNEPFEEVEMCYVYDVASFLNYYSNMLSLAGLSRLTGINPQQLSHYATGRRRPSPKTVKKIADAIHAFGRDMSTAQFA